MAPSIYRDSPVALVTPAKSHPDIVVQAVAARDRDRAEAYAKKHGIPDVLESYQGKLRTQTWPHLTNTPFLAVLDNPNIDCILIPLPNSLHFEWAAKAIRTGKHVLIEKPSTSNGAETEVLFTMPELSQPGGPVLIEASHNRWHPAFQLFQSYISPPDVVHVDQESMIPWWYLDKKGIHFKHTLSGGAMMAMGCYGFAALRLAYGELPEECVQCEVNVPYTEGERDKVDWDFKAKFRFPDGGTGEARSTLSGGTFWKPSHCRVVHRKVPVADDPELPKSQAKTRERVVTMHGMLHPFVFHRLYVSDSYEIRDVASGDLVKKWTEKKTRTAYSYEEAGGEFAGLPGEKWWMDYRYMVEEFVNRIRGRPTQYWISPEDSIASMRMIDMAYTKSGLGARPTSEFVKDVKLD